MEEQYIEFDFSYIDVHLSMITTKIINKAKLSIFNGYINKIYLIEKENNNYRYYFNVFDDSKIEIGYEELVEEIMTFYKSSNGRITLIYRIFTNSINSKTNGEFRELWGDMLYISSETLKFTSENINANQLSIIVFNLDLSEEEQETFGRIEEYVFKDDNDNIIMGIDLL